MVAVDLAEPSDTVISGVVFLAKNQDAKLDELLSSFILAELVVFREKNA